jgi:hypothetical protein
MAISARLQRGVSAVRVPVRGHVIRDEEIEVAVLVEIRKGASRAPQRRTDAGNAGDVGEPAAAGVAVQHVRPDVRDVEIDAAIVVVIAGARAHPVVAVLDPGLRRDILERAIAAVPEQPVPCLPRHSRIGKRPSVDKEQVDPAVVVVIEKQAPGAHRFDEILVRTRAVDMAEVDAGLARCVGEPRRR